MPGSPPETMIEALPEALVEEAWRARRKQSRDFPGGPLEPLWNTVGAAPEDHRKGFRKGLGTSSGDMARYRWRALGGT